MSLRLYPIVDGTSICLDTTEAGFVGPAGPAGEGATGPTGPTGPSTMGGGRYTVRAASSGSILPGQTGLLQVNSLADGIGANSTLYTTSTGSGIFIGAMTGGTGRYAITYSYDGINWLNSGAGYAFGAAWCRSVAAGPSLAMAIIADGLGGYGVKSTTNAVNWNVVLPVGSDYRTVQYGNGRWIVTIGNGTMIASDDNGLNWSSPVLISGGSEPITTLANNGSTWVAGTTVSGTGLYYSTNNGDSWALCTGLTSPVSISQVVYFNGQWLAADTATLTFNLLNSADGAAWSQPGSYYIGYALPLNLATQGSKLVVSTVSPTGAYTVASNSTFTNPLTDRNNDILLPVPKALGQGNSMFVAGGTQNLPLSIGRMIYSYDGDIWYQGNWTSQAYPHGPVAYLQTPSKLVSSALTVVTSNATADPPTYTVKVSPQFANRVSWSAMDTFNAGAPACPSPVPDNVFMAYLQVNRAPVLSGPSVGKIPFDGWVSTGTYVRPVLPFFVIPANSGRMLCLQAGKYKISVSLQMQGSGSALNSYTVFIRSESGSFSETLCTSTIPTLSISNIQLSGTTVVQLPAETLYVALSAITGPTTVLGASDGVLRSFVTFEMLYPNF